VLAIRRRRMATRSGPTIISTTQVARALNTLMRTCPLAGRSLEDAIGQAPVRHGHVAQFDFDEAHHQSLAKWHLEAA
jgi:hypothetical protein